MTENLPQKCLETLVYTEALIKHSTVKMISKLSSAQLNKHSTERYNQKIIHKIIVVDYYQLWF